MRLSIPKSGQMKTSVPTSSMADIAFLLIVFFMLTSVFSSTQGMDIKLNADETPPHRSDPALHVNNLGHGVVVLNKQSVSLDRMNAHLADSLRINRHKPVLLETSKNASYAEFVEVYDQLMVLQDHLSAEFSKSGVEEGWSMNISIPTHAELKVLKQLHPDLF